MGGSIGNIQRRIPINIQNPPSSNTQGKSWGTQQSQLMLELQKKDTIDSSGTKSSRKRRKSTPVGIPNAGSSGSTLTIVGMANPEEPMEDFQRHTIIQQNFWANYKQYFFFDQNIVEGDINQRIPPRN